MANIPDKDLLSLIAWAHDYQARLPDPKGDGLLAAELRAKLLGHLARGFDAKAPPFDVEKVADGAAKASASLGVLLQALHFFLSVGADGGKAMLISEMAWQLINERIKARSLSLN